MWTIVNLEALEKKNFLLQPGIEPRSFGCLARRLVTTDSDYAIPSPVFLWIYSKHERSYSGVDYVMQLDECWRVPVLYFQHAINFGHCTK
jgi:predicted GNAT superfamily acetyltransferase